jgi:REP element-mobilizing transposase RayT
MPKGLRRFHNTGQRHFITCSCYRRQPFLGSARRRDYFLKIFEEVRQKYDLVVWGYVVMPEHFHVPRNRTYNESNKARWQACTPKGMTGMGCVLHC